MDDRSEKRDSEGDGPPRARHLDFPCWRPADDPVSAVDGSSLFLRARVQNAYRKKAIISQDGRVIGRLEAMRVFVTALDEGSLARAWRRLGRPPAAVTRAIAFLESHVRVQLLHRTTRVCCD